MSWVLAFVGFCLLIVLHELGHFAAAKAVGMRVEKFSLFFGRPLWKVRRGETEYAVGWIPAGGYVKISGMDPREELPAEVLPRAYFRQPVWKRIVVIAAGPLVNVVLAFVIIFGVYAASGVPRVAPVVDTVQAKSAAAGVLRPDDKILRVDGAEGFTSTLTAENADARRTAITAAIARHRCAGSDPRLGCSAATPARVTVLRDGREQTFSIAPRLGEVAAPGGGTERRMLLGIGYGPELLPAPLSTAVDETPRYIWYVTSETAKAIARIFYDAQARKDIGSVVGAYDATRRTIEFSVPRALILLGVVSLSLAIINLAPFLPLDGGHIFWAIAEKLRGRPIPFTWLERASVVGFVLVAMLFVLGLTNDVGRFLDGTASQVR
ncbi:RIP metalloprotease [Patulibacter sp. SYSU D01012]|uniref:M50 family metallopeptidase n=1 Tax=Patulibacter sp. SYSU D01012 TaxID=2817381 RepID=UPI001B31482C